MSKGMTTTSSIIATTITTTLAAVALTACAAAPHHAAGHRPAVLAASDRGACRTVALIDLHNVGHCRVQVVARDKDGTTVGATPWIATGARAPRFELPSTYAWVVLEVDPGCRDVVGSIRYTVDRTCTPALDAGL
ncbi:MAG TPA: hypothetical protein VHE35_09985 [Kofleriaceae bacterium]|nr:hypothetical protein [Kofleriaceae bacterium]